MERNETCPSCHHVVAFTKDQLTRKCPNCGASVSLRDCTVPTALPDQPFGEAEQSAPPPNTPAGYAGQAGADAIDRMTTPVIPVTRTASIVAFIFSLLFFVPFITQLVALVIGLFAIFRPRQDNERVTLAWVGLVISMLAAFAWGLMFSLLIPSMQTRITWTVPPYATMPEDEDWQQTADLADTMERIYRAASAHHRDFGNWPDDVETLVGQSLPRGFKMPKILTYRRVPADQVGAFDWILIISEPLRYNRDGELLGLPHRLILRTNGKVEFLPSDKVEAMTGESDDTGSDKQKRRTD